MKNIEKQDTVNSEKQQDSKTQALILKNVWNGGKKVQEHEQVQKRKGAKIFSMGQSEGFIFPTFYTSLSSFPSHSFIPNSIT